MLTKAGNGLDDKAEIHVGGYTNKMAYMEQDEL
jgi:hypothetical protein